MNCPFEKQPDDTWKCPRCQYQTKSKPAVAPPKSCKFDGLGDRIEKVLLSFGITKARYVYTKKILFGRFAKEECDCDNRKEYFNLAGWKWFRI